SNPACVA
nr:Chain X, Synthetic peptide 1 [synthetic construct]